MDHMHTQDHGTADHAGSSHVPGDLPMSSLLEGLPETQHNQLLEMLHVPLLHGGVTESFLLPSFTTDSDASFAVACILLAIAACIIEILRFAVWYYEARYLSEGIQRAASSCRCKHNPFSVLSSVTDNRKNYSTMSDDSLQPSEQELSDSDSDSSPKTSSRVQRSMTLASLSLLQMFVYLGSTLLMLVAMTMNIFLIMSLGVGTSIGKLVSLILKQHLQAAKK